MGKVCRIVLSVGLNTAKYEELLKQANMLGDFRKEIWHRFGSLKGVGVRFRELRDELMKTRNFHPLPAKAWKETLRDVLDDIKLYEDSAKEKVRKDIYKRTQDQEERKRLYKLLNSNEWPSDSYLNRKMRQYKKHGRTSVDNQIVLEGGVYSQFEGANGNTWLKVPTFKRGKPICIPLNSNVKLKGCLRLILKDGIVYVHHTISQRKFRPCGDEMVGVDKGYSEAFVDSDGTFYGKELGEVLTEGTEERNRRGKARNKLREIAKRKKHKAAKISKYNLGRKKLENRNRRDKQLIRDISYQSAHELVDKAKEVRAEDLTQPFSFGKKWKGFNRRMSSWAKGQLAEALETVTKARGSCLRVVNAAYTSQMDSNTGRLEGRRVGDKFYHVNGEVSHADINAAVNVKQRGDDTEITRYTSHREVKTILLNRLTANGGVNSSSGCDRPSMTPVASRKRTSTESELPEFQQI